MKNWILDRWEWFLDTFVGEKCEHCGKRHTTRSNGYTRGYNEWCRQAIGDSGIFCSDCCKVTWDRPYKQYEESLPDWCRGYPHA